MKEKATIYDLWRMCRNYVGNCTDCPLKGKVCTLGSGVSTKEVDEINEIVLKWCKEHPVKTRQDKFLEMFPNAKIDNCGTPILCPQWVDKDFKCNLQTLCCDECCREYWLEEVGDDE